MICSAASVQAAMPTDWSMPGRRGLTRYYGMYSHGRNFYYYIYVPGRLLYRDTPINLIVSFFACAIVLTLLLFVRRGTEKSFLQQQKTLEKEYQTSLEQKNAELERAIRQETAANRAKREFLFNMSHDIPHADERDHRLHLACGHPYRQP